MMYHFDLPQEALWGFIGWLGLMLVNTIRRWQNDRVQGAVWKQGLLTKAEHAQICEKNQEGIKQSLEKIDQKLDDQNMTSAANHSQNLTMMGGLATRITVLETIEGVRKT